MLSGPFSQASQWPLYGTTVLNCVMIVLPGISIQPTWPCSKSPLTNWGEPGISVGVWVGSGLHVGVTVGPIVSVAVAIGVVLSVPVGAMVSVPVGAMVSVPVGAMVSVAVGAMVSVAVGISSGRCTTGR